MFPDPRVNLLSRVFFYAMFFVLGMGIGETLVLLGILKPIGG